MVKHYISKKREDIGLKLRIPGDYMSIYTTSGYTQEQKRAAFQKRKASMRVARSPGSLANNPSGGVSGDWRAGVLECIGLIKWFGWFRVRID